MERGFHTLCSLWPPRTGTAQTHSTGWKRLTHFCCVNFLPGAERGGNGVIFFQKQVFQLSSADPSRAGGACPGDARVRGDLCQHPQLTHDTPLQPQFKQATLPTQLELQMFPWKIRMEPAPQSELYHLSVFSSPAAHLPVPQSQSSEVLDGCVPELSHYAPISQWGHSKHVKDRALHATFSCSSIVVPPSP